MSASSHGIDARELRAISAPLVNHHQLEWPARPEKASLLTGYMQVMELEPGMHLRLVDVHDHFGITTRAELPAGVKIALVVAGQARVRYGRQEAELGPASSIGLITLMPSSERFVRQGQVNGHERTITLSLTPQWLAQRHLGSLLEAGNQGALQLLRWTPTESLLATAANLFSIAQVNHADPLYQMHLGGFALSLASEALRHTRLQVRPIIDDPAEHRAKRDPKLTRLMTLVESGHARNVTQAELAQQLGMSLSNLQRRFRAQCGEALGHYLRRKALSVAREALLRHRVSVETAAELAGYTSAPNFATAFRREFGITPSECRAAPQETQSPVNRKPPLSPPCRSINDAPDR